MENNAFERSIFNAALMKMSHLSLISRIIIRINMPVGHGTLPYDDEVTRSQHLVGGHAARRIRLSVAVIL